MALENCTIKWEIVFYCETGETSGVYMIISKNFTNRRLARALIALPILYALTLGINIFTILHTAPTIGWLTMPKYFPVIAAAAFAIVTAMLIQE